MVLPSEVMKTSRQSSSIFYLRRDLIISLLEPLLQTHPIVFLLLSPPLPESSVFSMALQG